MRLLARIDAIWHLLRSRRTCDRKSGSRPAQTVLVAIARATVTAAIPLLLMLSASASAAEVDSADERTLIADKIDSLMAERTRLETAMTALSTGIGRLSAQIDSLNRRLQTIALLADSSHAVSARTIRKTNLLTGADFLAGSIASLPPGTTVTASEWYGGLFRVQCGDLSGWVGGPDLEETPELAALRTAFFPKYQADQAVLERQKQQERATLENRRRRELAAKWGTVVGPRIGRHEVWIGMTSDMARASIGDPREINRTVTAHGIHEQWVYTGRLLYFEDGVLTAWQD